MKTVFKFFLLLLLFWGPHSLAYGFESLSCPSICLGPQVRFGARVPKLAQLPSRFRLLIWNLYKGGTGGQEMELQALTEEADIAIFQEALATTNFARTLTQARPDFFWALSLAYQDYKGVFSGVTTGSSVKPVRTEAVLSTVFEPITNSPKSHIVSEFRINRQGETLMVINIHAINFVSTDSFSRHMQQVLNRARLHSGPLLVGGDLNTWNDQRLQIVQTMLESIGLKMVSIPRSGYFILDHLFVRGVKVHSAEVMGEFQSSDHYPLLFDLELKPSQLRKKSKYGARSSSATPR